MSNREKIILAVVGAITVAVLFAISSLSSSPGQQGGTTLSDVFKELVDNVSFIGLCALLILALVFLPVGL